MVELTRMLTFDFPSHHPHELVLFFYPSPGLDWSNPKALTFTTARNKLLGMPRGIGHVAVLVRSPERTELTGMTQTNKNEGRSEVLFGGYGLGILLHNFAGEMEQGDALVNELLRTSNRKGKLSYLRVLVNDKVAQRLFTYIDEFQAKNYGRYYGMRNRPLYGEGSGCSAFAASFLEVAGLLKDEHRSAWTRTFNIPRELIGGPSTGKKISVLTMLRQANRWAHDHEPHEKGFFWDPDLMHRWLVETYEQVASKSDSALARETWNQTIGIRVDAQNTIPPTGKIFLHE